MGLGLPVLGADGHYARAVWQNTVLVIANVQVGGAGARAADIDAGGKRPNETVDVGGGIW